MFTLIYVCLLGAVTLIFWLGLVSEDQEKRIKRLEEALSIALQYVPLSGEDAERIYELERYKEDESFEKLETK